MEKFQKKIRKQDSTSNHIKDQERKISTMKSSIITNDTLKRITSFILALLMIFTSLNFTSISVQAGEDAPTITVYMKDENDNQQESTITCDIGDNLYEKLPQPTVPEGKQFDYWQITYTDGDSATVSEDYIMTTLTEGIYITAVYKDAEETVTILYSGQNTAGTLTWTIDSTGKLTVTGSGEVPRTKVNYVYTPEWCLYTDQITSAEINLTGITDAEYFFYRCSELTSVNVINFDTSNITNMNCMFQGCSSLTNLDLSTFDTSNVTNMKCMIANCNKLVALNISNFNTSKVTNMSGMFSNCKSIININVSNFDTSKVTKMSDMFSYCILLTNLNLSNFNTSKVTDMSGMFNMCESLTELNISNFNTQKVESMYAMFEGCSSLTTLNVSNFDTSSVGNMRYMFKNCSLINTLNISNFNTTQVRYMNSMFYGCSSLQTLDLSNFDTTKVTDMSSMFYGCSNLATLKLGDNFVTTSVTDMSSMFQGCNDLTELNLSNFNISNVLYSNRMWGMLYYCNSLQTLYTPYNCNSDIEILQQYENENVEYIWKLTDGNTVTNLTLENGYYNSVTIPVSGLNHSVLVTRTTKTYTVTFKDYNDTILKTDTVAYGNDATAPSDPYRDGYTFKEWDTDFTNVTSDLTVTATYTQKIPTVTVNYINSDGETLAESEVYTIDENFESANIYKSIEGYSDNMLYDLTYSLSYNDKYENVLNCGSDFVNGQHVVMLTRVGEGLPRNDSEINIIYNHEAVLNTKFVNNEGYTIASSTTYAGLDSKTDSLENLRLLSDILITSIENALANYSPRYVLTGCVDVNMADGVVISGVNQFATSKSLSDLTYFVNNTTENTESTITIYVTPDSSGFNVYYFDEDEYTLHSVNSYSTYDPDTDNYDYYTKQNIVENIDGYVCTGYSYGGYEEVSKVTTIDKTETDSDGNYTSIVVDIPQIMPGYVDTIILTYKEVVKTYTVTFKDYDGTVLKTDTVTEGTAATAPAAPTRDGYTFTNWDTAFTNVQSDLTVNAVYTQNTTPTDPQPDPQPVAKTYTVTFKDYDGTVLKTETVKEGSAATAPAAPTRTGYNFKEWDKSFSSVTSDLTVTATYSIKTYTVTFKDYNGTILKTDTVEHGKDATAPSNPTREGYTFTNWSPAFNMISADMEVIAVYTIKTYTVTFKDYDGTILKTETVDYNSAATAPSNPSREGYTFKEWNKNFTNVTSDITITAVYTQNETPTEPQPEPTKPEVTEPEPTKPAEETKPVDTTPTVNDTPVVNDTPIVDDKPVINDTPVETVEETPSVDETPVIDDTPVETVEDTPVDSEEPDSEEEIIEDSEEPVEEEPTEEEPTEEEPTEEVTTAPIVDTTPSTDDATSTPKDDEIEVTVYDNNSNSDTDKDTKATAFTKFVNAVKIISITAVITLSGFGLILLLLFLLLLWTRKIKVYNNDKVVYRTTVNSEGSFLSMFSNNRDRVWTITIPDTIFDERESDTFQVALKTSFTKKHNGEQLVIILGQTDNARQLSFIVDAEESTVNFTIND